MSRKIWFIGLLLMLFGAVASTTAQAQSIEDPFCTFGDCDYFWCDDVVCNAENSTIENGDFSAGETGWTDLYNNVTTENGYAELNFSTVNAVFYQDVVSLTQGVDYCLYFRERASHTTAQDLMIQTAVQPGNYICNNQVVDVTTEWQYYSRVITKCHSGDYLRVRFGKSGAWGDPADQDIDDVYLCPCGECDGKDMSDPCGDRGCETVSNADFVTDTVWSTSGGAVITDCVAQLSTGGAVSQSLTITDFVRPKLIVSGTGSLDITYGAISYTLPITRHEPGFFWSQLFPPDDAARSLVLESASGDLAVDYACLAPVDLSCETDCPSWRNFTSTVGWTTGGGATVNNHVATLPANSYIERGLQVDYPTVLEVLAQAGQGDLNVSWGTFSTTVEIDGAEFYYVYLPASVTSDTLQFDTDSLAETIELYQLCLRPLEDGCLNDNGMLRSLEYWTASGTVYTSTCGGAITLTAGAGLSQTLDLDAGDYTLHIGHHSDSGFSYDLNYAVGGTSGTINGTGETTPQDSAVSFSITDSASISVTAVNIMQIDYLCVSAASACSTDSPVDGGFDDNTMAEWSGGAVWDAYTAQLPGNAELYQEVNGGITLTLAARAQSNEGGALLFGLNGATSTLTLDSAALTTHTIVFSPAVASTAYLSVANTADAPVNVDDLCLAGGTNPTPTPTPSCGCTSGVPDDACFEEGAEYWDSEGDVTFDLNEETVTLAQNDASYGNSDNLLLRDDGVWFLPWFLWLSQEEQGAGGWVVPVISGTMGSDDTEFQISGGTMWKWTDLPSGTYTFTYDAKTMGAYTRTLYTARRYNAAMIDSYKTCDISNTYSACVLTFTVSSYPYSWVEINNPLTQLPATGIVTDREYFMPDLVDIQDEPLPRPGGSTILTFMKNFLAIVEATLRAQPNVSLMDIALYPHTNISMLEPGVVKQDVTLRGNNIYEGVVIASTNVDDAVLHVYVDQLTFASFPMEQNRWRVYSFSFTTDAAATRELRVTFESADSGAEVTIDQICLTPDASACLPLLNPNFTYSQTWGTNGTPYAPKDWRTNSGPGENWTEWRPDGDMGGGYAYFPQPNGIGGVPWLDQRYMLDWRTPILRVKFDAESPSCQLATLTGYWYWSDRAVDPFNTIIAPDSALSIGNCNTRQSYQFTTTFDSDYVELPQRYGPYDSWGIKFSQNVPVNSAPIIIDNVCPQWIYPTSTPLPPPTWDPGNGSSPTPSPSPTWDPGDGPSPTPVTPTGSPTPFSITGTPTPKAGTPTAPPPVTIPPPWTPLPATDTPTPSATWDPAAGPSPTASTTPSPTPSATSTPTPDGIFWLCPEDMDTVCASGIGYQVEAERPVFAMQSGEIATASGGELVLTYNRAGNNYRAEYDGMGSYDVGAGAWVDTGEKIGETAAGCFTFKLYRLY